MSDRMFRAVGYVVHGVPILTALLFLVAVYEGVQRSRVERKCLALGFPRGDWRWVGPSYCVKREGQTDVVKEVPNGR